MEEMLFSKMDVGRRFAAYHESIAREIATLSPGKLDAQETVLEVATNWRVDVPVLHIQQQTTKSIEDSGRVYIELTIPYKGNSGMFYVQPSRFGSSRPFAEVKGHALVVTRAASGDRDQIREVFRREVTLIEDYLGHLRSDAEQYNNKLPDFIADHIARRKRILAEMKDAADFRI